MPDAVLGMGFGFAEIGTVTPQPQAGNPRPRVFRLLERPGAHQPAGLQQRRACGGAGAAATRAGPRAWSASTSAPTRMRPIAPPTTWRASRRFSDVASYFTVNISSPNTPGLRDLQAPAALDDCWRACWQARASGGGRQAEGGRCRRAGARHRRGRSGAGGRCVVKRGVDGIAVTNTTLSREGLRDATLPRRPAASRAGRCSTARP